MMPVASRFGSLMSAFLGLATLLLLAAACGDDEEPTEAATTISPSPGSVAVAREFVEALGDFDTDRAAALLAPAADLSLMEGGQEDWRLGIAWFEAHGFELLFDECADRTDGSDGAVRCTFDYHGIHSDRLGLGPYGGSHYDIVVVDGRVLSAAMHLEFVTNGFSEQVWKPFATWVGTNHPDDLNVMYVGGEVFFEALTEDSIRLWETRSREFAEASGSG
jgi:hypothetical protein